MWRVSVIASVVALILGVAPVQAATKLTHHVDLLQVSENRLDVMGLGYHLSGFRFAGRVQLLGLGGGLNFPNIPNEAGNSAVYLQPYGSVSLVDFALKNPEGLWRQDLQWTREELGKWWPSIGVQAIYLVREKEWRLVGGLRFSTR